MIRLISIYGLIAGLVVAIPMVVVMTTTGPQDLPGVISGYLTMIVALTAVFLGVKRYRDKELGGVIRFMPAFLIGLGISFVASVIYAIGWEISLAITNFDFGETYAKGMVDAARAKGMSDAELEKVIAEAESFATWYKNPFLRVPVTFIEMFPVGVLISAISAALLRNSRLLPARATNT